MRRRQVRYRRNLIPHPMALGRKVRDEVRGGWTYEALLVRDAFGNKVDPRFGAPDTDEYRKDGHDG